eukprot:m.235618 g.235618  ORF g.235618 m.235618 type:complete len:93 (+) comp33666_c5_seq2:1454-1732(+)
MLRGSSNVVSLDPWSMKKGFPFLVLHITQPGGSGKTACDVSEVDVDVDANVDVDVNVDDDVDFEMEGDIEVDVVMCGGGGGGGSVGITCGSG